MPTSEGVSWSEGRLARNCWGDNNPGTPREGRPGRLFRGLINPPRLTVGGRGKRGWGWGGGNPFASSPGGRGPWRWLLPLPAPRAPAPLNDPPKIPVSPLSCWLHLKQKRHHYYQCYISWEKKSLLYAFSLANLLLNHAQRDKQNPHWQMRDSLPDSFSDFNCPSPFYILQKNDMHLWLSLPPAMSAILGPGREWTGHT